MDQELQDVTIAPPPAAVAIGITGGADAVEGQGDTELTVIPATNVSDGAATEDSATAPSDVRAPSSSDVQSVPEADATDATSRPKKEKKEKKEKKDKKDKKSKRSEGDENVPPISSSEPNVGGALRGSANFPLRANLNEADGNQDGPQRDPSEGPSQGAAALASSIACVSQIICTVVNMSPVTSNVEIVHPLVRVWLVDGNNGASLVVKPFHAQHIGPPVRSLLSV